MKGQKAAIKAAAALVAAGLEFSCLPLPGDTYEFDVQPAERDRAEDVVWEALR